MSVVNIIADIGGTNMRVAISEADGQFSQIQLYQCAQYSGLAEILQNYIEIKGLSGKTINACLAIACPVDNDLISMTNLPWEFSKSALKSQLGIEQLFLINDYTAIAHAVPLLDDSQKVQIGEGTAVAGRPISICGPGTGLGVANVVPVDGKWHSLSGEGGHVDFAPVDETEIKILSYLLTKYEHVSYEQLLSGLGIEQIYQALAIDTDLPKTLPAEQISAKALENSCDVCVQTAQQFCKTLGSFAGNLALTLGSFGGVYIAGGIVPRFIEFFNNSEFRSRFEAKGRLSGFNHDIPTFVITESQPGLLGASAYLQQSI
ncbi:glucokinase [Thalassotalea sp. PLHSN55]|uniref:glucokinase n=1 Tax=Thalassotalea sp. PLHSN55 TaxID=3435888 RepID=UPI003F8591DB